MTDPTTPWRYLTWGELKAWLAAQGVSDGMTMIFIDISAPVCDARGEPQHMHLRVDKEDASFSLR